MKVASKKCPPDDVPRDADEYDAAELLEVFSAWHCHLFDRIASPLVKHLTFAS